MKKLHYFPFYYLDWLSSSNVMMMTYEEKGLFIDMLCRCYNDEGLPDDNDKLQRLFKCDEHLLKSVKDMFYSVEGLLKNKKLDSICNDQSKMFTNKVNAGKASAKARADKKLQSATPVEHLLNPVATEVQQNPTNKTKQNRIEQKKEESNKEIFSNPPIDPTETTKPAAGKRYEFAKIYSKVKPFNPNSAEFQNAYFQAVDVADGEDVVNVAASMYVQYCEDLSKPIQYIPNAARWLDTRQFSSDWKAETMKELEERAEKGDKEAEDKYMKYYIEAKQK